MSPASRGHCKLAAQCAAEGADHPDYLLRLAELELIDRHRRMVQRRIRAVRFPAVKSLDTFDFRAIPSVNKPLVMQLARCEHVERRKLDFTQNLQRAMDVPALGRHHMWQVPGGFSLSAVTPDI